MLDRIKRMFSGSITSRYQIDAPVIKHAFYAVYTARDKRTMRPVLVKVYTDEGMDVQAKLDANYRERRLAEVLPELSNRFVVSTLEIGAVKGRPAEVLEAAPITTLRELMDHRRLSHAAFRRAMLQVGEGLAYLHSLGYVHRGLSPDAIVATPEGDAKILDLSLLMDASRTHASGTMVGPLGYVAPEVIRRGPVDARSDVYSLGVLCYEAFSGTLPFPRVSSYESLVKMINSRPTPLGEKNTRVSPVLDSVVMKALAKSPDARYQTVDEMLARLSAAPLPAETRQTAAAFAAA